MNSSLSANQSVYVLYMMKLLRVEAVTHLVECSASMQEALDWNSSTVMHTAVLAPGRWKQGIWSSKSSSTIK